MIAMRQLINKHIAIIILIFIIGAYLVIKAVPENSWDGWGVGSTQTMLSNKHWVEDGFFKNYFLFLPQGYSKTVQYFDDPELRQHARGITTGGFIGKRLYYTHYPSGYLLPTTILMKLGLEERAWFRFLEILFSLVALVFLYWIFLMISNRLVAILGVLYYGISVLFLDYADTLANQPIDEFLRFAIIALSIAVLNYRKHYLNFIIWILYFILALSSYDSTFFIFAWLIGLDLIIAKKIEWKKWLVWTLAPILAFTVQILQNTLYLGWHNMLFDLYGAFKVQMVGSRSGFLVSHLKRLIEPFSWFFGVKWYLGIFISILGISGFWFIQKHSNLEYFHNSNYGSKTIRYMILGFLAILFNFLFFPSLFFYQGRMVAIFAALLIGSLTVVSVKALVQKEFRVNTKIIISIIFITVLSLWLIQTKRTYTYIKQWPNNVWPQASIDFDKKIKSLVSGNKVIFELLGPEREVSGADRYPMAASEDEYYTDAPILGFTNAEDLIRDFNYLKNRSEFPFSAIIITDKKEVTDKISKKLGIKTPASQIDSRHILIISE
ncbi:MAG: hypothetical protein AAB648_01645 [Patescibacteria group bacterium]